MLNFFRRPHGGCYSCLSRSVLFSVDRRFGLCLKCGCGFRVEGEAQVSDKRAVEIIRREIIRK